MNNTNNSTPRAAERTTLQRSTPAYDLPKHSEPTSHGTTTTAPGQAPQAQPKAPSVEERRLLSSSDRLPGPRIEQREGTKVESL